MVKTRNMRVEEHEPVEIREEKRVHIPVNHSKLKTSQLVRSISRMSCETDTDYL